MKKGSLLVNKRLQSNYIFDAECIYNDDDRLYCYRILKNVLKSVDIDLSTIDIHSIDESEIIISNDFFQEGNQLNNIEKKYYLILFESELIRPKNWDKNKHGIFKKVFTWNDNWVDGEKYIKYYWPNKIPTNFTIETSKRPKLCTMIAGNKMVYHDSRELYSKRIKIIQWFEKTHLDDFDLYGMGWDLGMLKKPLSSLLKIGIFNKLYLKSHSNKYFQTLFKNFIIYFPSYKGKVSSKKEILSKYKFSICYENGKDIPGYITEKIFDCFFAGCIPIYIGAPNIADFIPENTFINGRDFENYNDLYSYIKNMPKKEYLSYLEAINAFVNGQQIYNFSAENFANIIANEITNP